MRPGILFHSSQECPAPHQPRAGEKGSTGAILTTIEKAVPKGHTRTLSLPLPEQHYYDRAPQDSVQTKSSCRGIRSRGIEVRSNLAPRLAQPRFPVMNDPQTTCPNCGQKNAGMTRSQYLDTAITAQGWGVGAGGLSPITSKTLALPHLPPSPPCIAIACGILAILREHTPSGAPPPASVPPITMQKTHNTKQDMQTPGHMNHKISQEPPVGMPVQLYSEIGPVCYFFWLENLTLKSCTCSTRATGMGSPAAGLAALGAGLAEGLAGGLQPLRQAQSWRAQQNVGN